MSRLTLPSSASIMMEAPTNIFVVDEPSKFVAVQIGLHRRRDFRSRSDRRGVPISACNACLISLDLVQGRVVFTRMKCCFAVDGCLSLTLTICPAPSEIIPPVMVSTLSEKGPDPGKIEPSLQESKSSLT